MGASGFAEHVTELRAASTHLVVVTACQTVRSGHRG
ncbi:hypothetical protein FraQA3DRAFT_4747 [Frankia sp. QA3]|nr:hypothetical protein FraQA3DRAFT_4747 [Frankia sp. QA3]